MIEIEILHHVSVPVTDLARSKEFYSQVLGLVEIERPPFDFPGAWYQLGDRQLHLIGHDLSTLRTGKDVDTRDIHFALRVRDYAATVAHLRECGYREDAEDELKQLIDRPNNATPWCQAYIMDPDRNVIEFNAER